MGDDRLARVLDAAYQAFTRYGIRRTTMDDIAAAAGLSRPAVYHYVRGKDDAYRRLARRMMDDALAEAARGAGGPLAARLAGILAPKVELTARLYRDSPHAAELLGANEKVSGDLHEAFTAAVRDLLRVAVDEAEATGELTLSGVSSQDVAELCLALAHGLEYRPEDPDAQRRLRLGVTVVVAGLAAGAPAAA